jgi:hypothetical protein
MSRITYQNNLYRLADGLQEAAQRSATRNGKRLEAAQRENVHPSAPASPAIAAGYYHRTPTHSTYSQAVSEVRLLFAQGWQELFAQTWQELFAQGWEQLFNTTWEQLIGNPFIIPEVPAPPDGYIVISNCTGWATANEIGGNGYPSFYQTIQDFEIDNSDFEDDWKSAAGVL